MEGLTVKDLSARILRKITFTAEEEKVVVVYGPNGAGKTTLLEAIAGIIPIKDGSILLNGRRLDLLPPQKRNISFIFQGDLALFPHLTVYKNVAFPLEQRKVKEARAKTNEMLERIGILHLKDRYPMKLSGGERQKVAIARALVWKPDLFLLDEPFANLDHEIRKYVRRECMEVIRSMGGTSIFVTHDPYEAEEIADQIIHLEGGILLERTKEANRLRIDKWQALTTETALAHVSSFSLLVPYAGQTEAQFIEFYPEDLYVADDRPLVHTLNLLRAKVVEKNQKGDRVFLMLDLDGQTIKGSIPIHMWNGEVGKKVYLIIKYRGLKLRC